MVMLLIEQELDRINACLLKGIGIYFPQFIKHEKHSVLFFAVFFPVRHFAQVCRFVVQEKGDKCLESSAGQLALCKHLVLFLFRFGKNILLMP